jgi:hypothetical protein
MIKLLRPALKQSPDEDRKTLAAQSVDEANSSSGLNGVRRVLTALAIRDAAPASMELSANTNYHVPGRNRVAGAFTDRQDIVQRVLRMFDFATSSESTLWVDWMVGRDRISVLVETHCQHGPSEFEDTLCFVLWFGPRSGVCDIRLFIEDRAWCDRFFSQKRSQRSSSFSRDFG